MLSGGNCTNKTNTISTRQQEERDPSFVPSTISNTTTEAENQTRWRIGIWWSWATATTVRTGSPPWQPSSPHPCGIEERGTNNNYGDGTAGGCGGRSFLPVCFRRLSLCVCSNLDTPAGTLLLLLLLILLMLFGYSTEHGYHYIQYVGCGPSHSKYSPSIGTPGIYSSQYNLDNTYIHTYYIQTNRCVEQTWLDLPGQEHPRTLPIPSAAASSASIRCFLPSIHTMLFSFVAANCELLLFVIMHFFRERVNGMHHSTLLDYNPIVPGYYVRWDLHFDQSLLKLKSSRTKSFYLRDASGRSISNFSY